MATYELTKRPVTVRAVPFNGDNYAEIQAFTGPGYFMQVPDGRLRPADVVAEVFNAPHGEWVGVRVGQWIIRGVVGELYPRRPRRSARRLPGARGGLALRSLSLPGYAVYHG